MRANTTSTQASKGDKDPSPTPSVPIAGLVLAGTTVFGTLALMLPFVRTSSKARIYLPFMGTPRHKVQRALEFLAQHRRKDARNVSASTKHRQFVDLGSGDGDAVYQAVLSGQYDQAVGVELNWTLYAYAQLRRWLLWSRQQRQCSRFLCQDMFQFNTARADTVFVFGVKPLMKPISEKLARECQPGTFVMSYRFLLPLEDLKATATQRDTNGKQQPSRLSANLIYHEEEMRIYECRGEPTVELKHPNEDAS